MILRGRTPERREKRGVSGLFFEERLGAAQASRRVRSGVGRAGSAPAHSDIDVSFEVQILRGSDAADALSASQPSPLCDDETDVQPLLLLLPFGSEGDDNDGEVKSRRLSRLA